MLFVKRIRVKSAVINRHHQSSLATDTMSTRAPKSRKITPELKGIVRSTAREHALVQAPEVAMVQGAIQEAIGANDIGKAVTLARQKAVTEMGCYLRVACMRVGLV